MERVAKLSFGSAVLFEGSQQTSLNAKQHQCQIFVDKGVFTIKGRKGETVCVSITNVKFWVPEAEAPAPDQAPAKAPAAPPKGPQAPAAPAKGKAKA